MKRYYIHKEGRRSIFFAALVFIAVGILFEIYSESLWVSGVVWGVSTVSWFCIASFFRIPRRDYPMHSMQSIIAPADGVIVDVARVKDPEYFDDERIRISVFMSPSNVHVNRYPIDGTIAYSHYHSGRYLVAWHPKSSTLNERNTVVVRTDDGQEILVRQIAGALARRIVSYAKVGERVKHGQELGFIKFGSRVDLLLPLSAEIKVEMEEKVKGGVTLLAEL